MNNDSKPRDFTYLQHKQNFPLEIKGTMRRRMRPQSSGDLKKNQPSSNSFMINDPALVHKIMENYQDLKSVVPVDLTGVHKKQSIKIYNTQKQQHGSGAILLMSKKIQKTHPEKKHLTDRNQYQNLQNSLIHKQRRHYPNEGKQKVQGQQVKIAKKHVMTLWKKIDNDLYSNIQVKQYMTSGTVKMSNKNMFKQAEDLGLEQKKEPRMSDAKKREVMGSFHYPQPSISKKLREDWRKTSIILG